MEAEFDVKKYKELVKDKGLTQIKLVQKFNENGHNIKLETIKSWTKKNNPTRPTLKNILVLSDILNIGANELIKNSAKNKIYNNLKPVKNVPIVGISSCGVPNISDMQEAEGYAIFSGDDYTDKLYCVVANGDSMSPDISDGDIVFCDPTAKVLNGDMVHYTLNNESAIKVYFKNEATQILELVPRNQIDGFKTSYIKLDDGSDIDIIRISKVVEVHHKETNNRLARLKAVGRA